MGLFRLFSRKKTEKKEVEKEQEVTKISIDNIHKWFHETYRNKLKEAEKESSELVEKIISNFSEMKQSINALEKAEFGEGEKIFTSANMVKDTFVKKYFTIMHTIQKPGKKDYASLQQFLKNSSNAINEMKSLSPKQKFLLSRYFKDEAAKVINDINMIDSNTKAFADFLSSKGKIIQLQENIDMKSSEYSSLINNMKSLTSREKEVDKEKSC